MKNKFFVLVLVVFLLMSTASFAVEDNSGYLLIDNQRVFQVFSPYTRSIGLNLVSDEMVRVWYQNNNKDTDMKVKILQPYYNQTKLIKEFIVPKAQGKSIEFFSKDFPDYIIHVEPIDSNGSQNRIYGNLSVRASNYILSLQHNSIDRAPFLNDNKEILVFDTFKLYGGYDENTHYSVFNIPHTGVANKIKDIKVDISNTSDTETEVKIYQDLGRGIKGARLLGSKVVPPKTKDSILGKPLSGPYLPSDRYFIEYTNSSSLNNSGTSKVVIEK